MKKRVLVLETSVPVEYQLHIYVTWTKEYNLQYLKFVCVKVHRMWVGL